MVIGMRAYVRTGPNDQVVELTDVPAPEPGAGEALIDVKAFGVGIHDRYFIPPDGPFPYAIGSEGAGVVTAVDDAVCDLDVGDRVMASVIMSPKGGTWAEYVAVDQSRVTPIPDALGFDVGGAFPVAGGTAVNCMHALALRPGETLFVAGASGAIGTLVVQLAEKLGALVAGSASQANHEYLSSLGADLAVDYRDATWPEAVRDWSGGGVDAALAIQPGTPAPSRDVVRDGGRVVTVSGDPCAPARGITVEQFEHRPDAGKDMTDLIDRIIDGDVRFVLEHAYAFEDALSALEKTETRHARGKLVVRGANAA